ncbi:MAG TPA: PilT/PilU family type 4a pilus ATPase, partial [Acidobacteriota bacterium]|nr:PilT/PilU family type 4a pilus ATPase [Acidobacteriota bacterium]
MHLNDLLKFMVQQKASDLHMKPMRPPLLRIEGKLLPIQMQPLPPEQIDKLLKDVLTEKQRKHMEEHLYVDFGYSLPGVSRFRATVFYQRGTPSAVFRRIPFDFPSLDDWGLPDILYEFTRLGQGLVLVTGPTGSGKSSTLAAMIKEISEKRPVHVVTIEDPIEFLFRDALGVISQREVGDDTHSFHQALRNTLRQDPDVIMVGEMRDPETIMTAMTAAETGHLVFSTLHTNSAAQSVDRIIDSFPEGQHRQVKIQLSQVLRGIISLKLVNRCDGPGMIAAVEILRDNPRISKLVLEGNVGEIEEEMEKSVAYFKMQTMNQSLIALILNGAVTRETAMAVSTNPADLDLELRKFRYSVEKKAHGEEIAEFLDVDEDGKPRQSHMEDIMATPLSDFSKIQELQEIKKVYEESRSKHLSELSEKEEHIQHLEDDLRLKTEEVNEVKAQMQAVIQDREKLKQQLTFSKNEMEGRIQRLQERIQQL